ncbi:hypothetical protein BH23BAC4_BH23BAC4_05080 [soil metagenome]
MIAAALIGTALLFNPMAIQGDTTGIKISPLLDPMVLYSPARGLGIGGGVQIDNLGAEGTEIVLEALFAQRLQRFRFEAFSSNPYQTQRYVAFGGAVSNSARRSFFGFGATSTEDNEVWLHHTGTYLETRFGLHLNEDRSLLVQPTVRFSTDILQSADEVQEGALARISSQTDTGIYESLSTTLVGGLRHGLEFGLEAAFDSRDVPTYPKTGILATVAGRRFQSTDGSGLGYWSGTAGSYGFLQLRPRYVAFANATVSITRSDDPLPLFHLPLLDNELLPAYAGFRFAGRDRVLIGAGLRFPVVGTPAFPFRADGLVAIRLGGAYDDVFSQFEPRISLDRFAKEPALKPALIVGGAFLTGSDRYVVGGMIGIGPEGFSVAVLRLSFDPRDFNRPLR